MSRPRRTFSGKAGPASTAGLLAFLIMWVGAACGSGSASTGSAPCTAGETASCSCTSGMSGAQVCASDGTYGACDCSGPLDATTGSSSGSGGASSGGSSGGGSSSGSGSGSGSSGSSSGGDATDSDTRDVQGDRVERDVTNESGGGDGGTCTLPTSDAGAGGAVNWAKNFGKTGTTSARAIATDPSNGDVVVVGSFDGTVSFGGGKLTSRGDAGLGNDAFIARFDSGGKYKWASAFGTGKGAETLALGVAVDSSGNVAVGGEFQGSVSFGGPTLTAVGRVDVFLAEFDSAGTYRWSKSFGAKKQSQGLTTTAVDSTGNVFISGVAYGGVDFGGGAKTGYYIAKFDSAGGYVWSDAFVASTTQGGPWLAVDYQGNSFLAGSFATTVNFGGGTLTSAGSTDAFVAKFDPGGAYLWAKQYGDASEQDVSSIAVDPCGRPALAGNFSGKINFGTGSLVATAGGNNFLARLDSSGKGAWAKAFGGATAASLEAGGVAVDAAGDVALTSVLSGSANYGGGVLASEGSESVVVASFTSVGAYRWSYVAGAPSTCTSSSPAYPQGVAAGAGTLLTGHFGGAGKNLVIAGQTLTASTSEDAFLVSFDP